MAEPASNVVRFPGPGNDNAPDEQSEGLGFLDVGELRTQYLDYLTGKTEEISEQQSARRYYHGDQWTPDQIRTLRLRRQPPLTYNRTARKINQIVGVVERSRSDPKALPRTPRSENGADLATETIRSVLERNDFKGMDPWCLLQGCIDGISGVQLVLTKDDMGSPDIGIVPVIADEYFYDVTSYLPDFSDNQCEGISKWVSLDRAQMLFPDRTEELSGLIQGDSEFTTNADRDFKWTMASMKRLRLVEHWYYYKGRWCWAFYTANLKLAEGESPFFNEKNETTSSYRMFSVAVDPDGDRYGFVRNLKGPQDSLNQSKSKSLHVANSRRIIAEKGAVDDVEKARTEMARPDGFVEVNPNLKFLPDNDPQDVAAFAGMADSAANEIEQFASVNIAVMTGSSMSNISGRAVELLQQPGMAELGPFILAYRRWKLALYRSIWSTAQRHWRTEKWLRMIDSDQQKPVFVQLNALSLDQFGRPVLVNALGAVDVDITLEEGKDVATLMSETYDLLKGYPPGTFPPQLIIEASQLPRREKNKLLKMMQPPQPNPAEQQLKATAARLQLEGAAVKNAKTAADARRSDAAAQKALADAQQGHAQTTLDAAELSHRMWTEALQIFQPQQPAQPQARPATPPGL